MRSSALPDGKTLAAVGGDRGAATWRLWASGQGAHSDYRPSGFPARC